MKDPQRCTCGTRTSRRCTGYKPYTTGYCRFCCHSRKCHEFGKAKQPRLDQREAA